MTAAAQAMMGCMGSIPISATASPSSVSGSSSDTTISGFVQSGPTTVSATGGTGAGKAYSWAWLSGSTFTVTSPSSATTSFSATVSQAGSPRTGVYRCTVSDGTYTATADVSISLTYTRVIE